MEAFAFAASAASSLAAAGSLADCSAGGVEVACMPLWGPLWWDRPGDEGAGEREAEQLPAQVPLRRLQNSLVTACASQGLAAMLQFACSDPLNGLIGCSIATLGMQAASPHGFRYLPSYIVLSFCNGSMQLLMGLEYPAVRHLLWNLSGSIPMKAAGALALFSPVLMFLGVTAAWKLHSALQASISEAGPHHAQAPPNADASAGELLARSSWQPFSGEAHRLATASAK